MMNRNESSSTEFTTNSGYRIRVTAMPPYYLDQIDSAFPIPDYPKRMITLASGDILPWEYELPEVVPEESDGEEFELYARWKYVDSERRRISDQRMMARMNYMISMCVEVLDGPLDFDEDSDEWMDRLEAPFVQQGYKIPEHRGEQRLLFLKSFVITLAEEVELIMQLAWQPEVTLQGILNSLQGFPDKMEEGATGRNNGSQNRRKSRARP